MGVLMTDLADAAIKTYRYLRVALIVLILTLAASVVLERAHATHLQNSISAYYYTPAHSILVATLVGLGACIIALKGCNDTEDLLLNIAGMLAPIVALVPTEEPSNIYGSKALIISKAPVLIGNNVVALLMAGAVALLVAWAVERSKRGKAIASIRKVDAVGLTAAAALILSGGVTYWQARGFFLAYAHTACAIAMFVVVGVVVVLNSWRAGAQGKPHYQRGYLLAACVMACGLLVFAVHQWVWKNWKPWKPWNFYLESVEIVGFAAFWIVQTFELWDMGVGDPIPPRKPWVPRAVPLSGPVDRERRGDQPERLVSAQHPEAGGQRLPAQDNGLSPLLA
jgi:hypothetical protein